MGAGRGVAGVFGLKKMWWPVRFLLGFIGLKMRVLCSFIGFYWVCLRCMIFFMPLL